MKKVLLLFWGKGGNVERAAHKVYAMFPPEQIDMFDVVSFDVSTIGDYHLIILGGSTIGAEIWTDVKDDNEWSRFFTAVEEHDLSGKYVAFFGLGDQVLYPDHYVDALAVFKEEMVKAGVYHVGEWSIEGYRFTDSDGYDGKMFFGLALDEDRQAELTEERVKQWTDQLKKEANL
jgi:flavodoxin I